MSQAKAEPGIVLRGVRRVVHGRQRDGHRVTYLDGDKRGTSERVIVRRCREAGYRAYRLPPGIWRSLARVRALEREEPGAPLHALLDRLRAEDLVRPRDELAAILRSSLSALRLRALLDRHSDPAADPGKPGVPDLFVFKRRADGRPFALRFVEVKRPKEKLQAHQLDEIRFMRSIGLRAGVLRVIEVAVKAR